MRYFIFLVFCLGINLQILRSQEEESDRILSGEFSAFYAWDNNLFYYGLKFAISQRDDYAKSYLTPLFEIGGNFGKRNNLTLVGITTLPGVSWLIQNDNFLFMKFDLLTGLGINSDDGSKYFGNYSEFRLGFGYNNFSLNLFISYFGSKELDYSNKGLMLSYNF